MSTFIAPVAAGSNFTRVTPSAQVPDLRFKGDRVMWIAIPAGIMIMAFASGPIARSEGTGPLPSGLTGNWTLYQLSPLPQMNAAAFMKITGGLPVQLVLVNGTGPTTPGTDDMVPAGAPLVTSPPGGAFLAFAFQDRLCRDPLTWAEAIAASGACGNDWASFIGDLAAQPNARNMRILDHRGAPATTGTFRVSLPGGTPQTIDLATKVDGDTGIEVPATSSATLDGTPSEALIAAAGDDTSGSFSGGGTLGGLGLTLAPGKRMAQILVADDWLAAPDQGVSVSRWNRDSSVEPIQEGTPYFGKLVADLRAAKPSGAAQLAGWAFVKGSQSDDKVDWPLVPGDATTTLINLTTELHNAGVDIRFLVNQFIQFDSAVLDDFAALIPLLYAGYAALTPLKILAGIATDPAGYYVGAIVIGAATAVLVSPASLYLLKQKLEYSQDTVDALNGIAANLAAFTLYGATAQDNPLVDHPPRVDLKTIDDISHFGVYHQKYVTIKRADGGYVAYLGGIDINNDRPDLPIHRAINPFHDVQVRITGPAVLEVIRSYEERATLHQAPVPIPTVSVAQSALTLSPPGHHLVQVARTYFKPAPGSPTPPLPFAPQGETTSVRTIINAIGQARDFIYIEDQYFTPSDEYITALLNAADNGVRALMITVPFQTDQPYGGERRGDVIAALQAKWQDRLFVGTPVRRFLHLVPGLTTNLGRMLLATPMTASASECDLAPLSHVPPPPFWAFVGGELMLMTAPSGAPSDSQPMSVVRATAGAWGATPVAHPPGTPVLAVQVPGIYVHAKLMIVDDVFAFVGSSNLNRRGFFHDGEMNSFTIPQHLKGDATNPARLLRSRLMAEHAALSPEMGQSLFADPISAIEYFTTRSWYQGAPRQPLGFYGPAPVGIGLATADSIGSFLLHNLVPLLEVAGKTDIWTLLVDPTTVLDTSTAKGPGYP